MAEAKTVKRTVRRPFFSYAAPMLDEHGDQIIAPDGRPAFFQKLAYRGEEIDVYPEDAARGDKHGVFLQKGESLDDQTANSLRLNDIGMLSHEQLLTFWAEKPPSQEALLEAVGDNSDIAVAVIAAENASEKPRKQLLDRLQKIADGEGGDD